jgi:hypothetical protein
VVPWACKLVAQWDTEENQEAELAIFRATVEGDVEFFSAYFRQAKVIGRDVLCALAACLVGSPTHNRTASIKAQRRGGPSKMGEKSPPTDREALAVQALSFGDERALALYLNGENVSEQVRQLIADALPRGYHGAKAGLTGEGRN